MVMPIDDIPTQTEEDNLLRVLLQKNLFPASELQRVLSTAENFKQTLFQYLVQYRLLDARQFLHSCSDFFQLPKNSLQNKQVDNLLFHVLPLNIIENNLWLPIMKQEKNLVLAIANPNDIDNAKKLSFQLGMSIQVVFVRYDTLYRLHNAYVSEQKYKQAPNKNDQLAQKISHQLLSDAIHRDASDIHFEPYQSYFRVRFRIDGLLHEIIRLPAQLTNAITSCLKVMARMDIAIKRTPQDGRLSFHSYLGFFKDCRVSTCPTIYGEKIVIRLLDANTQIRPIDTLGLKPKDQKIILQYIEQPQGLILVTGPTGSGKTITLYTLLNLLNLSHRNIATIEDPVEMHMEGINQTHINTKVGLTFSHTLRALLRQDPDVIMIGEIRDQETAEMAIRAAQTGHLVLSTLHTNSAAEAITRLCHMGITPFHLCSALTLIIAQRLVRKLCGHCQNGCLQCNNGFRGRLGIFEIMPLSEKLKEKVLENASHNELSNQNKIDGHLNLWESAMIAEKNRLTSLSEIYRVIPRG